MLLLVLKYLTNDKNTPLNTLKNNADKIYILENKTISMSGSHDELMQTDNFYSEYWR